MDKITTPRLLDASTILAEAEILDRGNRELELTWQPKSRDISLPNSRIDGLRIGLIAVVRFQLEDDQCRFRVCGFVGHSGAESGSCATFEEALNTAAARLAERVNSVWESKSRRLVEEADEKQKSDVKVKEALITARNIIQKKKKEVSEKE